MNVAEATTLLFPRVRSADLELVHQISFVSADGNAISIDRILLDEPAFEIVIEHQLAADTSTASSDFTIDDSGLNSILSIVQPFDKFGHSFVIRSDSGIHYKVFVITEVTGSHDNYLFSGSMFVYQATA